MRRNGLILLLVLGILTATALYFLQDRFIESAIEDTASGFAGAKVEVDGFDLDLAGLTASWNRLQVADSRDPWSNIIETGRARFAVEPRPLLWGRLIIDEIALEDVRSGTRRETDGTLSAADKTGLTGAAASAREGVLNQIRSLPLLDLQGLKQDLKVDSLIEACRPKSIAKFRLAAGQADSVSTLWQNALSTAQYTEKIAVLESRIERIKATKTDNPASLLAAVNESRTLVAEVDSLKGSLNTTRTGLSNSLDVVKNTVADARAQVKSDIECATSLAKLKDLDVKDVGMLLFGRAVFDKIEHVLGMVEKARSYLPVAEVLLAPSKIESPPRFEGQNISFPFKYRYPRFLIRQVNLSGSTGESKDAWSLTGMLSGLTTEPFIYGKPATLDLSLASESSNSYRISGVFDHVEKIARDTLRISAENFRLGALALNAGADFPSAVDADRGKAVLQGHFIDSKINLDLDFQAAGVDFKFDENRNSIASRIVREVLGGLERLQVRAGLRNDGDGYALSVDSNVDTRLRDRLSALVAENVQKAKERVEKRVNEEVEKVRTLALTKVDGVRDTLQARVDEAEKRLDAVKNAAETFRKEAEARIAAGKKDLKDKAKGAVGRLLGGKKKKN